MSQQDIKPKYEVRPLYTVTLAIHRNVSSVALTNDYGDDKGVRPGSCTELIDLKMSAEQLTDLTARVGAVLAIVETANLSA